MAELPLVDENLFIPDVIKFNIERNADLPFYSFVNPDNRTSIISHLEFGRAAHRMAHALRPERLGGEGQVVALIALADTILYQAVAAGLIVAGLVVRGFCAITSTILCSSFECSRSRYPPEIHQLRLSISSRRLHVVD